MTEKMIWSQEIVMCLIENYKQNQLLYRQELAEYKDNVKRQLALESIRKNLLEKFPLEENHTLTIDDIKKKLNTLKGQYLKEKRKTNKSSKAFWCYDHMQFLSDSNYDGLEQDINNDLYIQENMLDPVYNSDEFDTHRCRVCLMESSCVLYLHDQICIEENTVLISDLLTMFANISICSEDKKPQTVCITCTNDAKIAYKFKVLCESSDAIMNTALINLLQENLFAGNIYINTIKDNNIEGSKIVYKNSNTTLVFNDQQYLDENQNDEINKNNQNLIEEALNEKQLEDTFDDKQLEDTFDEKQLEVTFDEKHLEETFDEKQFDNLKENFNEEKEVNSNAEVPTLPMEAKEDLQVFSEKDILKIKESLNDGQMETSLSEQQILDEIYNVKQMMETAYNDNKILKEIINQKKDDNNEKQILEEIFNIKEIMEVEKLLKNMEENGNDKKKICNQLEDIFNENQSMDGFNEKQILEEIYKLTAESEVMSVEENEESNKEEVANKKDDQVTENKSPNETPEEEFKCETCGKIFQKRLYLIKHTRRGHLDPKNRSTKCTYCDYTAESTGKLSKHVEREHEDKKTISCSLCDKKFFKKLNLRIHMVVHTGVKKYKCEYCGCFFAHISNLKSHIRIHTGEKPYSCSKCHKSFSDKSSLYVHEVGHKEIKDQVCNVCGASFKRKSGLKNHIKTHKTVVQTFNCKICNTTFGDLNLYNSHMSIHSGNRDFKCDKCGKRFQRESTLKVHLLLHSGERPHVCAVCGKGFIQQHCLESHLLLHRQKTI